MKSKYYMYSIYIEAHISSVKVLTLTASIKHLHNVKSVCGIFVRALSRIWHATVVW